MSNNQPTTNPNKTQPGTQSPQQPAKQQPQPPIQNPKVTGSAKPAESSKRPY